MPNHLPVLLGIRASEKSINTLVSNGKRFTAYELVGRLQQQGHYNILDRLSRAGVHRIRSAAKYTMHSNLPLIARNATAKPLPWKSLITCIKPL
jgi:hypothetical protein